MVKIFISKNIYRQNSKSRWFYIVLATAFLGATLNIASFITIKNKQL